MHTLVTHLWPSVRGEQLFQALCGKLLLHIDMLNLPRSCIKPRCPYPARKQPLPALSRS
jgi:hypothetical protein